MKPATLDDPAPGVAAALALLLACAACGDDSSAAALGSEVSEAPPPAAASVRKRVPGPVPDAASRPAAPERVFHDRRPAPAGFDEYKRRYKASYEKDRWDTEIVAALDERTLRSGFEALLGGDPGALLGKLAEDFRATTALVPEGLESLRDGGGVSVLRADAFASEAYGRDAAGAHLLALVEPFAGCTDFLVEAEVTEVEQLGASFRALAHMSLAGRRSAGAIQMNFLLETTWRVSDGLQIAGWAAREYERITLARVPFADWTRRVLPEASMFEAGALELAGRHDQLNPGSTVYLGMNGMGVGDLDGDGLEDLYVARPGGQPNQLLRHLPDHGTVDVGPESGVDFLEETAGVLIVDLDGDGARDLALGLNRSIVIAWNDGTGHFPETTRLFKMNGEKVYSISAADADGDGDLDLYDTRYFRGHYGGGVPVPYHDARNGGVNFFWRNAGERTFDEDTVAAGLDAANGRFSLASVWEDLDADGDLDLYVTNDFGRNNLYRNDGGTFTDVALESGAVDMAAGMGVACADVDRDGDVDLYVSNMFSAAGRRVTAQPQFMREEPPQIRQIYAEHTRGNSLLMNDGAGTFDDGTGRARTGPGGWTWGAVFTDFDADGLQDLFVPNGFLTGPIEADLASFFWRCVVNVSPLAPPASDEYMSAWIAITELAQGEGLSWSGRERGYSYWNLGEGRFADATLITGLGEPDDGRTAIVCDWDGDGRLDLWVKNRTAPTLRLLQNRQELRGTWIAFEVAQPGTENTEAVGALVEVTDASGVQRRRVHAGEGYLGGASRRLHFGLTGPLEAVRVTWPDGTTEEHESLAPGMLHRLARGAAPATVEAAPGGGGVLVGAAPAPPTAGAPVTRVPLLARLPLGALPLPRFEGGPAPLAEHADGPLFVALWGSWEGAGEEALRALARRTSDLESTGLSVLPLSLDSVRDEPYVRALSSSLGFASAGARADRETRQVLEVLLVEVLGPYHDQPLPLGLLFDAGGNLACLYIGGLDGDVIFPDGAALTVAEPAPWPAPLTGGRWALEGPLRNYDPLIEYVRPRALPDLLAELEAARAAAFR